MPATPTPWTVEDDPNHAGRSIIRGAAQTTTDQVLLADVPAAAVLRDDGAGGIELAVPGAEQSGVVVAENMDAQDAAAVVADINDPNA